MSDQLSFKRYTKRKRCNLNKTPAEKVTLAKNYNQKRFVGVFLVGINNGYKDITM